MSNNIGYLDGDMRNKVNSTYTVGENSNRAFMEDFNLICSCAETHRMYKYKMAVKGCCELETAMEEDVDRITEMWLDGEIW